MSRGIIAEYRDKDALLVAIHVVRSRGFTRLEAYSPVPSEEIDDALGRRRSPLAIAAGCGALLGAAGGYALQWLLDAYLYPVDVGSRPPHMPLPYLIITIEMGFLFGGLCVFISCLVAARLLRLWDPVFEVPGFESASRAGFWLAVAADDPQWSSQELLEVLRGTGAEQIHGYGGLH